AEVQRQAGIETQHAFNLAETPLIRTSLLRLDENEHVLLINMHHIVSDGWSFAVLVQELEALYTSFIEGEGANKRVPLPELPIQYADYAVWQREWLEGRQKDGQQTNKGETPLKQQLEYWKQQLQGAPGVLELPPDHSRPAVQTYQGASETLMLDSSLARGLKTLGQQSADESEGGKYTLFMTLLAVFQILLSRYTGEEDIVVGAPFANRNRVEFEKLIGFFVNTLVLRTDLSHDPTFRELLKRVRRVCLEAYANQDVPFDSLIEELKPERDLSRTLLFQVFFNLLNMVNYPTRPLVWPGLSVEVYWPHQPGVKFDLTLYAQELDEGIRLEALYNADLFERSRIRELLAQMKYLVEQVIAYPDARISQLSLVTPGARLLLPDPGEPLSATWLGSVFSLFAEQAQAAPEHPALVDADGVWSYCDLNEHSNRLANHLLAQGIGPQAVVAIYARRAASLAWAVLGVLKTGATYMILDPSYPAARLSEYLRLGRASGFLQLAGTGELPSEVEAAL
ncbi:MAG TPA: condensation domain-containing protein, partial [Ktedonobacteraceae bacterium]|nr:condensation domain-containing protein [Ktedonobacteraceae bacterium]